MKISVSRVRFFGNINWPNVANKILYALFQGSNDFEAWNTISTIDQTVHTGWNTLISKD